MSQFFLCFNNCRLICRYQEDVITHGYRRFKNKFKKIQFIKNLSENNIFVKSTPTTKYFIFKLFKRQLCLIDEKKSYFFEINNKFGISKTILNDIKIMDIIKQEKNFNINNKFDGLFGDNLVTDIKLISTTNNKQKGIIIYFH